MTVEKSKSRLHVGLEIASTERPHTFRTLACPIIPFYSYKGGLGRTTTVAFVAKILADRGKKVIVIDGDLESPGLHSLLAYGTPDQGLLDYLIHPDANSLTATDWHNYTMRADHQIDPHGNITIMPAGNLDSTRYLDKLSSLDWERVERTEQMSILDELFKNLQEMYDFILIDLSAGWSRLASAVLFRYAYMSLIMLSAHEHHVYGIRQLAPRIHEARAFLEFKWIPTMLSSESDARKSQIERIYSWLQSYVYIPSGLDSSEISFEQKQALQKLGIRRNESLEHVTRKSLLDPLLQRNYEALAAEILKLHHMVEEDSTDLRYEIFKELNLPTKEEGGYAEHDFTTIEEIQKNFILPYSARGILEKSKSIIIGHKGSGKSALFSSLFNRKDQLQLTNVPYEEQVVVGYKGSNEFTKPQNNDAFVVNDDWRELEDLQKNAKDAPPIELFWKRVWLSYLLYRLQKNEEQDPAPSLDMITIWETRDWSRLAPYLLQYREYRLVEAEITSRNDNLAIKGRYQLVLYDNLETILNLAGADERGRILIIQSLVRSWFDLRDQKLTHLVPKMFIRTDIFDAMNFPNLSHKSPYVIKIEWDDKTLWRLVLKTLLSRSQKLRDYLQREWGKYEAAVGLLPFDDCLWSKEVDSGMGLEITTSDLELKFMVEQIFFERFDSDVDSPKERMKNSPLMYNWFQNRLRDGKGRVYPRELVQLVNGLYHSLRNKGNDLRMVYEEHYGIFPVKSIDRQSRKRLLREVAKSKWSALQEEYQDLANTFTILEHYANQKKSKWLSWEEFKSFGLSLDQVSREEISSLLAIGLLEATQHDEKYRIPEIYQFALGLREE